jgi:hypothetical protein
MEAPSKYLWIKWLRVQPPSPTPPNMRPTRMSRPFRLDMGGYLIGLFDPIILSYATVCNGVQFYRY